MAGTDDEALRLERGAGFHHQQAGDQIEQSEQHRGQRGGVPAPADRRRQQEEHEEDEERAGVALGQQDEQREQDDVDAVGGPGELGIEPPIVPGGRRMPAAKTT